MVRRMRGTAAEMYAGPVSELLSTAKKLELDPAQVPFAEMERLIALSRSISRSLGSPPPSVTAACAPCVPAPPPAQPIAVIA